MPQVPLRAPEQPEREEKIQQYKVAASVKMRIHVKHQLYPLPCRSSHYRHHYHRCHHHFPHHCPQQALQASLHPLLPLILCSNQLAAKPRFCFHLFHFQLGATPSRAAPCFVVLVDVQRGEDAGGGIAGVLGQGCCLWSGRAYCTIHRPKPKPGLRVDQTSYGDVVSDVRNCV